MTSARRTSKKAVRVAAACAAVGVLIGAAGSGAARGDVLLSDFELPLSGSGLEGWFNYNGNITVLGLVPNPTGGSTNWMSIEYNNLSGAWITAGPTIQPWANSNFSNSTFQANNFLQFDVIFPSSSWLSNDPALPVGINSNGGGDGLLTTTVNTGLKDMVQHVVIDYSSFKSSNGGPASITDWMNLLFGYPDESQWMGAPFMPTVYVDNIYLTSTSAPPALPPAPNSGSWDPTRSGDWTDTANWIGGVAAHGAGNTATFGGSAAPRTVNVNAIGIMLGQVVLDSPNGYTFTGNSITLESSTATPNANAITVNAGSHTMPAVSVVQASGDSTVFTVAGGAALTIDNLTGGGFGTYVKEGAGALTVDKMREVNLTINGGAVSLKPGNAQDNGFIFGLSVLNGSTFNMNGASLRVNSLSSNEVPGVVDLGTGGFLNMGIYGGAAYFGAIAGTGSIVVGALAATDPSAIGTPQAVTLGGDSSYVGPITVTNGGTLTVEHHNALGTGALIMDASTRVILTPGFTSAVRRTGLTIDGGSAPTATLDLANNGMVVDYTGTSPLATIVDQVEAGANTGVGIVTSQGAGYAVGYAEAGALGAVPSYFGTVDATAVLLRGTRAGDANLDGLVNLSDFNALAGNFGQSNRNWWEGDFNYDGLVNLTDFNALAGNFGLSAGADGVVDPSDWAALAAAVPEPGSLATCALAGAGLIARRRRRS